MATNAREQRRLAAADHDGQRTRLGAHACAGDGRIHQVQAPPRQLLAGLAGQQRLG
jgi:hypothetical protein